MAKCCDLEANEAMLCAYGLTPLMINLYVYGLYSSQSLSREHHSGASGPYERN